MAAVQEQSHIKAEQEPLIQRHAPLDKTYVRVMLALDDRYGYADSEGILQTSGFDLPDDTRAFVQAQDDYYHRRPVRVGEGGANYRTLLYRSYLEDIPVLFEKEGSLCKRAIYEKSDMITMTNEELLDLDSGTTQYVIARMIWDNPENVSRQLINREFKLQVARQAILDWQQARSVGERWRVPVDPTIAQQAHSFLKVLQSGFRDDDFSMRQPEDYCFARAYGYTTPEEGEQRWPRLRDHESDRIISMERAIKLATNRQTIDINDHRVVQAVAMRFGLNKERFVYPDCVTKSWPNFWDFIAEARTQASAMHYPA